MGQADHLGAVSQANLWEGQDQQAIQGRLRPSRRPNDGLALLNVRHQTKPLPGVWRPLLQPPHYLR